MVTIDRRGLSLVDVRFLPKATKALLCSEMTLRAMCGRIWTPPDCNGIQHNQDQGPKLLTYMRLLDAA
jgi:hypothetical protein